MSIFQVKVIRFFRRLPDYLQTSSRNSICNDPTFQLQNRTWDLSIISLHDESRLVTSFPSILDENKVSPRVPAQPNTATHDTPTFQIENRTQVVRVPVHKEPRCLLFKPNVSAVEKTGLEQFDLLSYIRSVSVLNFLFKLKINLVCALYFY